MALVIGIFLCILVVILVIVAQNSDKYLIREYQVPSPISTAQHHVFDRSAAETIDRPLPDFSGKLLSTFNDNDRVYNHMVYLKASHERITAQISARDTKILQDRQILRSQQAILFQMAAIGSKVVRRLEADFPKIRADLSSVPYGRLIKSPTHVAPLAPKNPNRSRVNAGPGIANGMMQGYRGGGAGGAVLAVAAGIAISAVMVQKNIRKVTTLHEEMVTYAQATALNADTQRIEHEALRALSRDVFDASNSLTELLHWAKGQQQRGSFKPGAEWNTQDLERLRLLKQYSLLAPPKAQEAV